MEGLLWGLVFGSLGCLILSAVAAVVAYRRIERLQKRAQQAERLAELGMLTGGLAHEIKNPLSTVQLNLQLLQEDIDPKDPAYSRIVNRLATVHREAARLKEILDDFLRYAGKIELDKKPSDVNALLEELVDFFSPQATLNKVQLRLRKSDPPLFVSLDARLIKQAILNLMINAVHAMQNGGGELILSAKLDGGDAIIDVIDTGNGILPESLPKIFNAYYSTKKGGTGLGLAVTRRIVEEHNGKISVASEIGKGTDFSMRLPISGA